jgi:hypothetical protein
MAEHTTMPSQRVVFRYLAPVHVDVEDAIVTCLTAIDDTAVHHPAFVQGEAP